MGPLRFRVRRSFLVGLLTTLAAGMTSAENASNPLASVSNLDTKMQYTYADPVDRSHPLFDELNQVLKHYIEEDPLLVDVHDLRAMGDRAPFKVSFDLVTDMGTLHSDYDEIYRSCVEVVSAAFGSRVDQAEIGIEAVIESAPMTCTTFTL